MYIGYQSVAIDKKSMMLLAVMLHSDCFLWAKSPDLPCIHTPKEAHVAASNWLSLFWAKIARSNPVRTSPLPAVAIPGFPVVLMYISPLSPVICVLCPLYTMAHPDS